MSLTTILIVLSLVIAFVVISMILLPKGARTREDVEKDKEKQRRMDEEKITSVGKWILIYLVGIIPIFNIVMLFILAFKKYDTNFDFVKAIKN